MRCDGMFDKARLEVREKKRKGRCDGSRYDDDAGAASSAAAPGKIPAAHLKRATE
jgi:ribosome assembly protein YihI (activator of Der GTPase)